MQSPSCAARSPTSGRIRNTSRPCHGVATVSSAPCEPTKSSAVSSQLRSEPDAAPATAQVAAPSSPRRRPARLGWIAAGAAAFAVLIALLALLARAGALARRRRAVGMVVAAIAARGEHRVRRRAVAGWPLPRVRRTRRHGRQERAVGAFAAVERARAAPGNRRRIEAVLVTRLSPHRFFCERQADDGRYREPSGSKRGCRRRRGRRRHMGT